jgi:hypothetical protein
MCYPAIFHRFALIITGLLILSACSSPGRDYTETGLAETLEITILPNDSKMFVYRLRWPEDELPSHIRVARSSRNIPASYMRQGVNVNRTSYERVQRNAAYVTANLGYCRDGFLELDGSASRYHMWLKGECREAASAEDRERFGEQKTLTMKPSQ